MQHTLKRLARVGDALNVDARHIYSDYECTAVCVAVGLSTHWGFDDHAAAALNHSIREQRKYVNFTYLEARYGLAALNPADVRELIRTNRNGKIPFLKSHCCYGQGGNDRQKIGQPEGQPKRSRMLNSDHTQGSPSTPSDEYEKHLRERHRTSYTSSVAETEATRIGVLE